MKLIVLNTWGGRAGNGIIDFTQKYHDADIFLFQEVFHQGIQRTNFTRKAKTELFEELARALPNHVGYFAPVQFNDWGLAAFVKRTITVKNVDDIFVYRYRDALEGQNGATLGRSIQYLQLQTPESQTFYALNFHGLWNGQGKSDSPGVDPVH